MWRCSQATFDIHTFGCLECVSDYSGLWQADNKISDRLRHFYRVEAAFRGQGITILMPEMFLFMVLRILMMVMAAQPVIGMPPGEVVAVFKKIHAPDGIALPVTFMLRFFPTVRSEFSDVFASLRLRKLLSWKHPWTQWSILLHLLFSVHPE